MQAKYQMPNGLLNYVGYCEIFKGLNAQYCTAMNVILHKVQFLACASSLTCYYQGNTRMLVLNLA